jgi:translation initiation factor IF-2
MKVVSDAEAEKVRNALRSRAVRGSTVRGKRDFRVRDISTTSKSPSVRPRPDMPNKDSKRVVTRKVIKKVVRRVPSSPDADPRDKPERAPSSPEKQVQNKPAPPSIEDAKKAVEEAKADKTPVQATGEFMRDQQKTDHNQAKSGSESGSRSRRRRDSGRSDSQQKGQRSGDSSRRYAPVGKSNDSTTTDHRTPPRPKIPKIPTPNDYLKPKEQDLTLSMEKLASGGMRSAIDSKKDKVVGKGEQRDGKKKRRRKIITGAKGTVKKSPTGGRGKRARETIESQLDPSTTIKRKIRRGRGRDRDSLLDRGPAKRKILIEEHMSIRDLSAQMGLKSSEIITFLMRELEIFATINQVVDQEIAGLICDHFEYEYELKEIKLIEDVLTHDVDTPDQLVVRPPVVTVLGHVDHGKTKLLDAIRGTDVVATEAGGITQKIGAFKIEHTTKDGQTREVTFIDTPGHAAFTAMRARGAQVTDVAILVVAANDGVMPQTIEAIDHAKSAGVEIVVAINKIDLPDANPDRVKQQLAEYQLVPEEWGGETIMVPISAKQKIGIEDLLENVLTVTEVLELKGNPDAMAEGYIIEARLDKGRGALATVLVQRGTLDVGDYVVAGRSWGRVRQMTDEDGTSIEHAGPSTPVLISGLNNVPAAGDKLNELRDEKTAKDIFDNREMDHRQGRLAMVNTISLEDFYSKMTKGETKELNIILKGDLQGSIEAIRSQLEQLSTDEVAVSFIHTAVGNITDSDVMLAIASKAIIIGFNVVASPEIRKQASMEGIDIRTYNIIYKVVEDIHAALEGLLEPEYKEVILGAAEVKAIFKKTGKMVIAGLNVNEGKLTRGADIRIYRDSEVIHKQVLSNLRHFDKDVREIDSGKECGIMLEGFNDLQEGDKVVAYETIKVLRTLTSKSSQE